MKDTEKYLVSVGYVSGVEYALEELTATLQSSLKARPIGAPGLARALGNIASRIESMDDELQESKAIVDAGGYLNGEYVEEEVYEDDEEEECTCEMCAGELNLDDFLGFLNEHFKGGIK